MKMSEIITEIRTLAKSQGFYGRLLEQLLTMQDDNPEAYEMVSVELERQNFRDPVDLILYLES